MNESELKTFETTVQREGKFTFVSIPFSPREVWGARPHYHVTGTINGCAVRGCLGASGDDYFLRIGAAWMRDNRIGASANVIVNLSPEGPQGNNLAEDIAKAISDSPNAEAFFNGLPTFYRKNYIRWIEGAKRDETRAKRIGEMINLLENGKREK